MTRTPLRALGRRDGDAGIGTVGAAAAPAASRGAEEVVTFGLPPSPVPYQPDNYYVKRLLELGIVGLWLTVLFLRFAIGSAQRARRRASGTDTGLADGIAASIIGASSAAFFATYWEIFPLDLYFWMLLGVVLSITHDAPEPVTTHPATRHRRPISGVPPMPDETARLPVGAS